MVDFIDTPPLTGFGLCDAGEEKFLAGTADPLRGDAVRGRLGMTDRVVVALLGSDAAGTVVGRVERTFFGASNTGLAVVVVTRTGLAVVVLRGRVPVVVRPREAGKEALGRLFGIRAMVKLRSIRSERVGAGREVVELLSAGASVVKLTVVGGVVVDDVTCRRIEASDGDA